MNDPPLRSSGFQTTGGTTPHAHRLAVNASWLIRLRWVAITGQLLTIGAAYLLVPQDIRLVPLVSIVAVTALTNVLLIFATRRLRRHDQAGRYTEPQLAGFMFLDLVFLTLLLMYSGGPHNPFALFYLVNLALAAVLLPRAWSWPLVLIGVVCLALVFLWYHPIEELERAFASDTSLRNGGIPLPELGLFLAVAACAAVIVYFVTRVTGELQLRESELRDAELAQARAHRLEGLATLAAGAGHELASPLSTIAVVAKELQRHLADTDAPDTLMEDARLIRTELDRCRTILNRMTTDAGQVAGDELRRVSLDELLAMTLEGVAYGRQIVVSGDEAEWSTAVFAPPLGLAQAMRAVLQNAHDASPPDAPIGVRARRRQRWAIVEIRDRGTGMANDVIARAGEPFFTTKEPGQGMGLGLFLARSVVERLDGALEFRSDSARGTTVVIRLPRRE